MKRENLTKGMIRRAAMTLNGSTSGFDSTSGLLTLNFDGVGEGSTIAAGTPFIVKWTGEDVTSPVFNGVTISNGNAGKRLLPCASYQLNFPL